MATSATALSTIPTGKMGGSYAPNPYKNWWLRSPGTDRDMRIHGIYRVGYDGIVYIAHVYENSYGRKIAGLVWYRLGVFGLPFWRCLRQRKQCHEFLRVHLSR